MINIVSKTSLVLPSDIYSIWMLLNVESFSQRNGCFEFSEIRNSINCSNRMSFETQARNEADNLFYQHKFANTIRTEAKKASNNSRA